MAGRGLGAGGPQDLRPGLGEFGRWAVKYADVGQQEELKGRGRLAGLEGRVGACWGHCPLAFPPGQSQFGQL